MFTKFIHVLKDYGPNPTMCTLWHPELPGWTRVLLEKQQSGQPAVCQQKTKPNHPPLPEWLIGFPKGIQTAISKNCACVCIVLHPSRDTHAEAGFHVHISPSWIRTNQFKLKQMNSTPSLKKWICYINPLSVQLSECTVSKGKKLCRTLNKTIGAEEDSKSSNGLKQIEQEDGPGGPFIGEDMLFCCR